jgi:hypothetical protein
MTALLLRSLGAAGVLCLLALGVVRSSDGQNAEPAMVEEAKDDAVQAKPAVPAAKPRAKAATKSAAPKAAATDDGRITVGDWLDVGAKVVDAFNELLGNPLANRRVPAAGIVDRKAAVPAPDFKQFEAQYGEHFRMLYRAELHLMRMACQPTRQQYEKVATAGETDLKAAMETFARICQEQRFGRPMPDTDRPDLRKVLTDAVGKAVKANLPPDKAERYRKELEQREVARKRFVVLTLVSAMDRKLGLSAEQRDRLTEVLEKNWQQSWNRSQVIQNTAWYFPSMPDDKILPVLTENQKTVWRNVQKIQFSYGFELINVQKFQMPEEIWPDSGDKK